MSESLPPSSSGQMKLLLMSSAEASPARTSAKRERAPELKASARAYGRNTPVLLARFDLDTSSWRTSQHSLLGGLEEFSGTWPRSGTMQSGTAYQLTPLVPRIDETASGLWPTPTVAGGGNPPGRLIRRGNHYVRPSGKKAHLGLDQAVKLWPSPTARDTKGRDANCREGGPSLPEVLFRQTGSGRLNPPWVEWLMGFPIGHTELESLGNAVVPQIPELIGRAILEARNA